MGGSRHSVSFLLLVAGATLFDLVTSLSLPATVASHFAASGAANGFMPRAFYVRFMLAFNVVLPLALVYLPNLALRNPRARINLPHREYWLAPERRAETVGYLCAHSFRMGSGLVVFLAYVHSLVVRANAQVPPGLSSSWFLGGLGVFAACALVWFAMLFARFRTMPP